MGNDEARIVGISRHRLVTDGDGVTSLVVFHGCPLRCRYCLNPHTLGDGTCFRKCDALTLYEEVRIDELYFLATNGGVTFGGGEPALHPDFIHRFRELCGPAWRLTLETSLNVPRENVEALLQVVDSWIIDIKDMDADIYRRYTGEDNSRVLSNLGLIADAGRQNDCMIRLPLIPDYNTDADREESRRVLSALGYSNFDLFTYLIRKH